MEKEACQSIAGGSLSLESDVGDTSALRGAASMSSGSASGPDASGAVKMDNGVAVRTVATCLWRQRREL
jgi:hypothetical protein